MILLILACIALVVGFFVGAVGVGTVLMVPTFALAAGLPIHSAAGTALFTGVFAGIWGTWLFARTGHMPWRMAVCLATGSALGSYPGAQLAANLGSGTLTVVIAMIIVLAGILSMRPVSTQVYTLERRGGTPEIAGLVAVGILAGFGAGLSGAGGPVFAVPILLLLGYPALPVVACTSFIALTASVAASVSNWQHGFIDYRVALWAAVFLLAGQVFGVRFAHRANPLVLRRLAAGMCIVIGAGLAFVKH